MARTKPTARKTFRNSDPTEGYSCTLYKDYLVFFGGVSAGQRNCHPYVYDLKERKIEQNFSTKASLACTRVGHSACYYEPKNMILIFGGQSEEEGLGLTSEHYSNPALKLGHEGDGLSWHVTSGIIGKCLPSSISHFYEGKIYLYEPCEKNGNFGSLRSYDLNTAKWQEYYESNNEMKLHTINHQAIFIQGKLYLLTENVDPSIRARSRNSQFIEDVYVLTIDKKQPQWERISCSGQVPGLLSNISLAETNGVIYIFGSSVEEVDEEGTPKSVLWAFDTNQEKWNKVHDIVCLIARPHQKAVIYKEQLMIVDWSSLDEVVSIQYQSLEDVTLVCSSPDGKKMCKDKPENLVSDVKNLYDGKLFHDVVFEVEGEEIPAHKAILAYRSNYFMRMFTSGMSESHSAKISIPNMKPQIFKALLQYMYCNEIELDERLALDLIPVVDEYLMKGLKGLCEKYLCKQLRKENVVDMLIVADRHEIDDLKKACFKFILKNLSNIDENEEMMKLTKSLFIELLKFNTPGLQEKSTFKIEKQEEEEKFNSTGIFARSSPMKSQKMNSDFNVSLKGDLFYRKKTAAVAKDVSQSRSRSPVITPRKPQK